LVVAWNRAAERLYGYSPREALGRPIVSLIVPSRGRQQAAEITQALMLGRSWEGELDARRSDGRLIRVLVHDTPRHDSAGAVAGVVGYSVPAAAWSPPPPAATPRPAKGWLTRAFREAMFDPSVGVGLRLRAWLIGSGLAFELAWALVARWMGRGEAVGVAGAVAILGVLAIAITDVWAGLAVALIAGVGFVVVVGYATPPAPFAFGVPLVVVWIASALAASAVTIRLRAHAQRAVAEAVALHRELVGSLVPAPRLRRVDVSVASLYRPGEQRLELGGDFYAAIQRDDDSIALLVGDVSGHGPAAAAIAAMLRAGWEALVEAGVSPEARLRSLNQLLLAHAQYEEFFATVCSVVIDPGLNQATIALAGHPPPILTRAGAPIPFDAPTGMPLGVSDLATWTPARIALQRPFSLLLYTDGVIEGRAAPRARERFGDTRLGDLVRSSPAKGRELLEQILREASEAHGGPLPDDAALLLLEYDPAPSANGGRASDTDADGLPADR
jgi:serine phosphatase RsbU (regulator of sigma subunit)